jgi:hypothetical protein
VIELIEKGGSVSKAAKKNTHPPIPSPMLDINKVAKQLPGIGQHLVKEAKANLQRVETAKNYLDRAKIEAQHLEKLQQQWGNRLFFNTSIPIEPLDTCIDIAPPVPQQTVIATDGSQIAPSHHEIAYCYLINVGRVMIHYGQNLHPLLDSIPEVFYQQDDLYLSRQWGVSTEEWMGYRRTASEATALAELASSWVNPPFAMKICPSKEQRFLRWQWLMVP